MRCYFLTRLTVLMIVAVAPFVTSGCSESRFDLYRRDGKLYLEAGQYAAARGLFLAANDMVPENADNLCDLASCHVGFALEYQDKGNREASLRHLEKAINYYDRAIKSYPGYRRALAGKNRALECRGEYAQALDTAEWASEYVGPSAKEQIFLAKEYAERGDVDRALLAYRQAVAMEPTNPTAHWALGFFYLDIGKQDLAVEHLRQSYSLDPTQTFVANTLVELGVELPENDKPAGGGV